MRRQVKPFVTEYRGGNRRSKDSPGSGETAREAADGLFDRSAPWPPLEAEDSYEAAMRAADALFSPQARREDPPAEAVPSREPSEDRGDAAPAPDAVFAAVAPSQPSAAQPFAANPFAANPFAAPAPASPPRRILEAIEPPQEDRFAAMEAERAPKRRGRKPGSKNRPKEPVVVDDWAAMLERADAAHSAASLVAVAPVLLREPAEVPVPARPLFDEPDDGETVREPKAKPMRFGRKRDELRPGERWKRRLPKSAR